MIRLQLALSQGMRVEIEGMTQEEALVQAAFFHDWPNQCPLCGSALRISHRQPQGYEYFGLRCTGTPAHETTFGVHKEGKGLYYKGDFKPVPTRGRSDEGSDGADEYGLGPEPPRQQRGQGPSSGRERFTL